VPSRGQHFLGVRFGPILGHCGSKSPRNILGAGDYCRLSREELLRRAIDDLDGRLDPRRVLKHPPGLFLAFVRVGQFPPTGPDVLAAPTRVSPAPATEQKQHQKNNQYG
jgi:hypothetical protein